MDEMVVAHILVSLEIREGLVEDLEILSRGKAHKEKLDYEGVPFQCKRCHQHGDIANQCNFPFQGWMEDSLSQTA
jgi:hypothetical protein